MIEPIKKTSTQRKTRIAGGLFLLLVATSACTEFFFRGRLGNVAHLAAGIVEVVCMTAVTLLLYDIFRSTQKLTSLVAMCCNLLAIALLLAGTQLHSLNVGLALHAAYWILIAYLMYRSSFFPRMLSVLPAIAGLCWLTFLSQSHTGPLSRYSLSLALVVEGLTMLWFLVAGGNFRESDLAGGSGSVVPHK